MKKMQHCFWCGEELGVYDSYGQNYDTCGKRECEREAARLQAQERDEAHEQLDRDMGWDRL